MLRTALDLVDREGVDALSMRRLGRELGVEAMSLYSYVENKQDLVDGVVAQVYSEMPLISRDDSQPWPASVRLHAGKFREVLLRHPNAVGLLAARPVVTEPAVDLVESALRELQAIGLGAQDADRVLTVIVSFTVGHVAATVSDAEPRPVDEVRAMQRRLDPARYPHVRTRERIAVPDPDAEFSLGMDLIIAGIERLLEQTRAPQS